MRHVTNSLIAVPMIIVSACGERGADVQPASVPAPVATTPVLPPVATSTASTETAPVAPVAPAQPAPTPAAKPAPPFAPAPAPLQDWCLVARGESWIIAQDRSEDERKGRWFTVRCFGGTDWTTVPWDTLPPEPDLYKGLEQEIPAARVAPLATCNLGVTPPEAAHMFVPLPRLEPKAAAPAAPTTPPRDPSAASAGTAEPAELNTSPDADEDKGTPASADAETDTAGTTERKKAPPIAKRALPQPVPIPTTEGDFGKLLETFKERIERRELYDIHFEGAWRMDVNQDLKDEFLAIYRGHDISPSGGEEEYSPHDGITEGIVWTDGCRPKQLLDINLNTGSDHADGLVACGLVEDPESGLVAVALHDSGTMLDGEPDTLALRPFDPTAKYHPEDKPLTVDPWPIARVRDPSAQVLSRRWKGFNSIFGIAPGMTLGDIVAVLNRGRAPKLDAATLSPDADNTVVLASGPSFRFNTEGRLVGLSIPSPTIVRALAARGFDDPLLDLVGQSARAAARALGGSRLDRQVFDGRVDATTGITVAFGTNDKGVVQSLDIQWYPLRKLLDADTSFAGVSIGDALVKVPKGLGDATATDDGWHIPAANLRLTMAEAPDGIRRLATVAVDAAEAPAPALARDPLLSLVGGDAAKLVAALGAPDVGDTQGEATWFAPSAYRPAFSLHATITAGRVVRMVIKAAP